MEEAYVGRIKRYIYFYNKRYPKDMGVPEIGAVLYSNESASLE
jgi:hypothetical protein